MAFDGIDWKSFGIGFGVGVAASYGVYQARRMLASVRASDEQQPSRAAHRTHRSPHRRYSNELIKAAQTSHLAGDSIPLSDILIEPRFIRGPELVAMPEEDAARNVFDVVSQVHEYPYLHAPYNLETLSIEDLGKGDRIIALLGQPGSGRTTALYAIALWSMQQIEFEMPSDDIQEQLNKEEEQLSQDERAQRIRDRFDVEQRAKEQLAAEQGGVRLSNQTDADLPALRQLAPYYIHLDNIQITRQVYGRRVDPAEPFVRALQFQAGRVSSKTMPRSTYKQLEKGQALILIDGYDPQLNAEHPQTRAWLQAFIDAYGHNTIIIAGPAKGYGSLLQMGCAPVFLRPWSAHSINHYVDKWAASWSHVSKQRRVQIDEETVLQIKENSWALSPTELTLKIWSQLGQASPEISLDHFEETWVQEYLQYVFPDSESLLPELAQLAALQLDYGFITIQQSLAEPSIEMPASPSQTIEYPENEEINNDLLSEDDDPDDLFLMEEEELTHEFEDNSPVNLPDTLPAAEDIPAPVQTQRGQDKLLKQLIKRHLLVVFSDGCLRFRHSFLASYLASLTFSSSSSQRLIEKSTKPAWDRAIGYAALHTSIDEVVRVRMQAPPDILHNNLLGITRWLAFADPDVSWRGALLKHLGNLFIAQDQYVLTRERIAAALVGSKDEGVEVIFAKALQDPNPDLRRISCLALGATRNPEFADPLVPYLNDSDIDVQIAASLALGAIGSDSALDAIGNAMEMAESEHVRQAVAETFAAIPDEGHSLLYHAVEHEDIMIRRAAIFGLRRIRTDWALIAVYRVFLDDQQWYVRSAAQQVFLDMQSVERQGARSYPPIETMPWLMRWASELEDESFMEASSDELLTKAIEDETPIIRHLAAATIGQLGIHKHTPTLYTRLYDPDESIRDTAYHALGDLQSQIGQKLPTLF